MPVPAQQYLGITAQCHNSDLCSAPLFATFAKLYVSQRSIAPHVYSIQNPHGSAQIKTLAQQHRSSARPYSAKLHLCLTRHCICNTRLCRDYAVPHFASTAPVHTKPHESMLGLCCAMLNRRYTLLISAIASLNSSLTAPSFAIASPVHTLASLCVASPSLVYACHNLCSALPVYTPASKATPCLDGSKQCTTLALPDSTDPHRCYAQPIFALLHTYLMRSHVNDPRPLLRH